MHPFSAACSIVVGQGLHTTLVFPYLGLREIDPAYSVEIGCVVGINNKQGPNYTADAGVFQGKSEAESEAEMDEIAILYRVHKYAMQDQCLGGFECCALASVR